MPFTFAHPAIVLPLKNRYFSKYFSLTGLVAGSLMPDFEYFIRMKMESNYSHTISGVFFFDLPLGIIFCFLFHNIIRNDLFANLPSFLRSRLCAYNEFNWNKYFIKNHAVVMFSLLIGSFSHLLWDSFTHVNGYFVEMIDFLKYSITFNNVSIPVYKMLQHLSSFFGCLIIFYAIMKLPKCKKSDKGHIMYWPAIGFTMCVINAIPGFGYRSYGDFVVIFISAMLIALITAPLLLKIKINSFARIKPKTKDNITLLMECIPIAIVFASIWIFLMQNLPFQIESFDKKSEADSDSFDGGQEPSAFIFEDSRDGKKYNAAKIGRQVWMTQNLNYKTANSKCYGDKPENCLKYGRRYQWESAMIACPIGWHLPAKAEWEKLTDNNSKEKIKKLKAKSGWDENNNGTNEYYFNALPGGNGSQHGGFSGGNSGYWWSSSHWGIWVCSYRFYGHAKWLLGSGNHYCSRGTKTSDESLSFYSVRCVKD